MPPGSSLALRLKGSITGLTISLLISRYVDCSGDVCSSCGNTDCGAALILPSVGCPRIVRSPACPLGPEAPWKGVDMNSLDVVCKMGTPKTRGVCLYPPPSLLGLDFHGPKSRKLSGAQALKRGPSPNGDERPFCHPKSIWRSQIWIWLGNILHSSSPPWLPYRTHVLEPPIRRVWGLRRRVNAHPEYIASDSLSISIPNYQPCADNLVGSGNGTVSKLEGGYGNLQLPAGRPTTFHERA